MDDPLNRMSPPIFGTPTANYNPFGLMGGNGPLGVLLAQYGPQLFSSILGKDVFLPGQFPAQNLMDQMVSAKYMRDSQANAMAMNAKFDSPQVMQTMVGIRSKFTDAPLTALGQAQLQNVANMVNDPSIQGLMGVMFGAQNVEDIFYGRRGSATMLANSVNQMGFSRRDAVTGQDRMSAEGLQAFTEQIYSNLYGPNADLNDVSGFSAGRVGTLATELSRRGLLPASIGGMAEKDRMRALRDKSNRPADLSPEMTAELDSDKSFEEIVQSETGAAAVRKVDATRVSNKLKEYTGAISAVREIFGANGMGNAPMQQLVAAMDALTQNSSASMSPGKIENLMRRVQLASRDSGVSLDALMGLSARGGALADANGLDRSLVGENVVQAMQTGQAMRETGAFEPGFGKMDVDKAGLFALDRSMSASASSVSRYMAVAKRIVAENAGNAEFESGRGKGLIEFVNAIESGATTYKDPATGQTVDVYRQMGENPGEFFSQLFKNSNVSTNQLTSYYFDQGTQEYMAGMATKAAYAQSYEIKSRMASVLASDQQRNPNDVDFNKSTQGAELTTAVSREFSAAMLDEVDTAQTPAERLAILQESVKRGFRREAAGRLGPGATDEQISKEAEKQFMTVFGTTFDKPNQKFLDYVAERQAYVERAYTAEFGGRIQDQRTVGSAGVMAARQEIDYRNMVRAAVGARTGGSGGNFLQRINDVLRMDGSNTDLSQMAEIALGGVAMGEYRKQLIDAAGGQGVFEKVIGGIFKETNDATIDNETERRAELDRLNKQGNAATALESFKSRFTTDQQAQLFTGKTQYKSNAQIAAELESAAGKDANKRQNLVAAYNSVFKKNLTTLTAAEYAQLAQDAPYIEAVGQTIDLSGVLTETQANVIMQQQKVLAGSTPEEIKRNRERTEAIAGYTTSMNKNTTTSADILGVFGDGLKNQPQVKEAIDKILKDPKNANEAAFDSLLTLAGGKDSAQAQQILNATKFARAQQAMGGSFESMGAPMSDADIKSVSRFSAAQQILDKAKTPEERRKAAIGMFGSADADKILAEMDAAKGTGADAAVAQKKLRERFSDAEKGADPAKTGFEATVKDQSQRDQINQEAGKLGDQMASMAGAAGDMMGGMFAGIGDSIVKTVMPPVVEELKKAFKDIKIENVSIGNISVDWSKMFTAGTQAAAAGAKDAKKDAGAGAATGGAGGGGSGPLEFVGELKLIDLYTAIVKMFPKTMTTTPGNGPGVSPG